MWLLSLARNPCRRLRLRTDGWYSSPYALPLPRAELVEKDRREAAALRNIEGEDDAEDARRDGRAAERREKGEERGAAGRRRSREAVGATERATRREADEKARRGMVGRRDGRGWVPGSGRRADVSQELSGQEGED